MKKQMLFLAAVLMTACVFAQTPQKMSYQAVIRNSSNALVTSSLIYMQVSILQGTNPVYVEQHNPATNADGLISIEIGDGTVISGSMSSIDWSSGTYYIKTEVDLDGMGYTITGTSQLLSVPYALQAKSVDGITLTNISNWNAAFGWGNHAGLYRPISYVPSWTEITGKPTLDGSETKINAGTNVTVTGSGTTTNPYIINAAGSSSHYVGELYQGGVVFYVDNTGSHGLICNMVDLSTSTMWSTLLTSVTGALSDWDGAGNTTAIAAQTTTTCAADICDTYTNNDYGTGVYSDWYLPSRSEMMLLVSHIYAVQKALTNDGNAATVVIDNKYNYWTSTEYNASNAFVINLSLSISSDHVTKNSNGGYVRAIRAF